MENPINPEHLLLDAVNILLESVNEPPIDTEEDFDALYEARMAKDVLIEVKRAVLSEGWDCNTDEGWTFAREVDGTIPVPYNVLDIVAKRGDVVMRNWRLYSKRDHSHVFDEDIEAKVIWDMDFNAIPHPLRHYITIRAARVFAARLIGDKNAIAFTAVDEEDAYLAARRSETRTGKHNMLNGTYGINNKVRFI